jgi:RHS repeat-associated protein
MVDHSQNVFEQKQYYFQADQIGSSNYVTDASGNVFEHLEYFPTGETWVQEASDTQNIPFQFAGKPFDPESGFYYMGARYYDPRTGIFESPDPALVRKLADLPEDPSKPSGLDTFAPSFLDLYNYADDQPLTKVDPDGQQAVPLTTYRLRAIATAAGIGAGLTGVQFNRAVGRAFQEFANNALGLTENFTPFPSPARAAATGGSPAAVIPDAVRDITKIEIDYKWGFIPQYSSTTFPNSSFFEVKAVAGVLSLSYSNSQIRGLIDVAARSPASGDTGPDRVLPTITFITTGNTVIGPDVLAEATRRGVAIWQVIAYETPGSGGSQVGFTPALPLNPQVFPTRGFFGQMFDPYIPVPPLGGAAPGTLGPASSGGPPLQPDPVVVQ